MVCTATSATMTAYLGMYPYARAFRAKHVTPRLPIDFYTLLLLKLTTPSEQIPNSGH